MNNTEILLIHLGGLGDVCLSESIFLSLQKQFGNHLVGLGNRRFLNLFSEYFLRVEGVESRKWLYLFSERLTGPTWRRIVFIGKDREGRLRERWQKLSDEKIIFIDMYPEGAFDVTTSPAARQTGSRGIQRYQLKQLAQYGIEPVKKAILLKESPRVILYPEKGYEKEKWGHENFIFLYHLLKAKGVDVIVLESLGLPLHVEDKVFFEDLGEIKEFFASGGIFVSNDSGMAHLAGASGLFTITIFTGFDPAIWRPRGRCMTLKQNEGVIGVNTLEEKIGEILKKI